MRNQQSRANRRVGRNAIAALIATVAGTRPAMAANDVWNVLSGNWSAKASWQANTVPVTNDNVYLQSSNPGATTSTFDMHALTITELIVSINHSSTVALLQVGGGLGGNYLIGNGVTLTGTVEQVGVNATGLFLQNLPSTNLVTALTVGAGNAGSYTLANAGAALNAPGGSIYVGPNGTFTQQLGAAVVGFGQSVTTSSESAWSVGGMKPMVRGCATTALRLMAYQAQAKVASDPAVLLVRTAEIFLGESAEWQIETN